MFAMAVRTRAEDSRTAWERDPIKEICGKPFSTSASQQTGKPSVPQRPAPNVLNSTTKTPFEKGVRGSCVQGSETDKQKTEITDRMDLRADLSQES